MGSVLGVPDVTIKKSQMKDISKAVKKAGKEYFPTFRTKMELSMKDNEKFELNEHLEFAKKASGDQKNVTRYAYDAVVVTMRPELLEVMNENEKVRKLPASIKRKACNKAVQKAVEKAFDESVNKYGKKIHEGKGDEPDSEAEE